MFKKAKKERKVKRAFIITILILLIIIIISFIYFSQTKKCETKECFLESLRQCKRASYASEEWFYRIEMATENECVVYVKNLNLKDTEVEIAERLKGKDMKCYIAKEGSLDYLPHENIDVCHGILKEEILRIMLEKMHLYIIQNIGEFENPMPTA